MNPEQLSALEKLAQNKNYGRGESHAFKVLELSLMLHQGLCRLGLMTSRNDDASILRAAALLHDIGLKSETATYRHNQVAFDKLLQEIPLALSEMPLAEAELSIILYCVLWHRGDDFNLRNRVEIQDLPRTQQLASILRVADALDRSLGQVVGTVNLNLTGRTLKCYVSSNKSVYTEIDRATEKSNLMKTAFGLDIIDFGLEESRSSISPVKAAPGKSTSQKRILLVCGGNTCRSPMAKVIFGQKLEALGNTEGFVIDSAAYDGPTSSGATAGAREAIMTMYHKDLLASHQAKKVTEQLKEWADLILVMSPRMKAGLPREKTYTLIDYAFGVEDKAGISDPYNGGVEKYLAAAAIIGAAGDWIIPKLLSDSTANRR